MIRGEILDLPLKGKMTETGIVEGAMSIVQATPRTGQAVSHLFIFELLLNKGIVSNKNLVKNGALSTSDHKGLHSLYEVLHWYCAS